MSGGIWMIKKFILIFVILIVFLGGMFISKGLDIIQPSIWTKSSSVYDSSDLEPINSPQTTTQQYAPRGGGMMVCPTNPNYNPQYEWYTPPKNGGGYWCW